ncbi:MAG: barstar family protein, partial [Alistipes sp.]|nr:barstar family protein [Alistipes sp.]
SLPDYYGNNLDALYDVLSTYFTPVAITILNRERLCENIPFYGGRFLEVLDIAARENEDRITIKTENDNMEEELW